MTSMPSVAKLGAAHRAASAAVDDLYNAAVDSASARMPDNMAPSTIKGLFALELFRLCLRTSTSIANDFAIHFHAGKWTLLLPSRGVSRTGPDLLGVVGALCLELIDDRRMTESERNRILGE